MSKVKYGIIGLGWFGEYHGDALAGLPNVELYALCTRTESRLKELGEKFGVKHLYTDYNEMLANPELEAVSVTTMWDQHREPAVAALEAQQGKLGGTEEVRSGFRARHLDVYRYFIDLLLELGESGEAFHLLEYHRRAVARDPVGRRRAFHRRQVSRLPR